MPKSNGHEFAAGMDFFIDTYVRPAEDEATILLYTSTCGEMLAQLMARLLLRHHKVARTWMHPVEDSTLAARLSESLSRLRADGLARLVIITLEDETFSHSSLIDHAWRPHGFSSARTIRLISACSELFETAGQAAPDMLSNRNATLLRRLLPLSRIAVTTGGGSDLQIGLNSDSRRWISNRGVATSGRGIILPAGEVATCPATIEGRFVADFAYNMNCHTNVDARLDRHPVTIEISEGRVIDFNCSNPNVAHLVEQTLSTQHGDRIGELGFGTNPRVVEPIARNSHINERHCGIHLGLGQHNQDEAAVDYYCPIHLDLIATGGRVFSETGDLIADLADLHPDAGEQAHHFSTFSVLDEDVFSPAETRVEEELDCCGGDLCPPTELQLLA